MCVCVWTVRVCVCVCVCCEWTMCVGVLWLACWVSYAPFRSFVCVCVCMCVGALSGLYLSLCNFGQRLLLDVDGFLVYLRSLKDMRKL